jgi:hypothetical protein
VAIAAPLSTYCEIAETANFLNFFLRRRRVSHSVVSGAAALSYDTLMSAFAAAANDER